MTLTDELARELEGTGRWIELMPLRDLLERKHPENPKDHDIPSIAASILRFGFVAPPELDERTGMIAEGHGRLEAIDLLSEEKPAKLKQILTLTADDTDYLVPVVRGWVSKDDDELRAFLVASNRTTIAGGWVTDRLARILEEQQTRAGGLDGLGYTPEQVADLLATIGAPPTLDQVAGSLGTASERELWPELHFRIPPAVKARYEALMAREKVSEDPAERFEWLVDATESYFTQPAADG